MAKSAHLTLELHYESEIDRAFAQQEGGKQGCLNKQKVEKKLQKGVSPADITIHEWLHTIEDLEINGGQIPNSHTNAP